MKIVRIIFAVCIGILTLTSCSSDEIKLPFDFGEGDFEEPFVGLLKSKPEVLVKSLDYFPFSLLSPDTLTFENEYEVVVNKECLRSRSSVTLQFRDTLYNPVDGVDFYVNGKLANNGDISFPLDALAKVFSVKMVLSPSLGDTTLVGNIYVLGDELDEVDVQSANGYGDTSVMLQYSPVKLSTWQCHQEIGWPLLLWILWLLTALVCLAIVIFAAYLVIKLVLLIIALIFGAIRSAFESVGDAIDDLKDKFAGREWRKNTTKRTERREEKKEEKKKDGDDDNSANEIGEHVFFLPWIGQYYEKGLNGIKMLIVGASHYCDCSNKSCKYSEECRNVYLKDSSKFDYMCEYNDEEPLHNTTRMEVRYFLTGKGNRTYRNFSNFMIKDMNLAKNESSLWDSVCFMNYVQFMLPQTYTLDKYLSERDYKAFCEVVKYCDPDVIIIWGKPVWAEIKRKEHITDNRSYLKHVINGKIYNLVNCAHPSNIGNYFYKYRDEFKKDLSMSMHWY